jgi:GNAT superfamily N-acetyltransferase
VPALEIHPFSEGHLAGAARLLEDRHARHRAAEALLPEGGDFGAQIERELGVENASGAVAMVGGEVAGYLIGSVDAVAEVGLAGCAARDPECVRDLYAHLASDWVAAGHVQHRVYVPATDAALVDAWFRLAFGLQFTFAVRETSQDAPPDIDVEIRPGGPQDLESLAAFDRELWEHQVEAPSFSGLTVPSDEAFRREWRDTWNDPAFTHFIAERDCRVVGHALLYRRAQDDLRIPEDSIDLAHAATTPEVRGSGVGLALTAHVLGWAHANGFRSMTTDWRVVNLLSSRFWGHRGWRPTFFRLYRHVP